MYPVRILNALWLPVFPLAVLMIAFAAQHYFMYEMPAVSLNPVLAGSLTAAFLGWRFHKHRCVILAFLLLMSALPPPLSLLPADLWNPHPQTEALLRLFVAVDLLLLCFLPNKNFFGRAGVGLFFLFMLQILICLFLPSDLQEQLALFIAKSGLTDYLTEKIPVLPAPDNDLIRFAVLILCICVPISVWRMARFGQSLEGGIIVTVVVLLLDGQNLLPPGLLYTAAALAALLAVMQDGYRMAFIDELTGLPGRRALVHALKSQGRNYAIAMTDIDHFKKFNDQYGHDVGDDVLRLVASRLFRVGGGGKVYRYGGEEFTLLFPGKNAAQAEPYLEDIRSLVADRPFTVRAPGRRAKKGAENRGTGNGRRKVNVSISIGIADSQTYGQQPDRVMKQADKALYRAKSEGRNRVVT